MRPTRRWIAGPTGRIPRATSLAGPARSGARLRITRWGQLLGLAGPEGIGQQIATSLGVPLHEHAAERAQYRRGTYRHRGRAIVQVLHAVGRVGGFLKQVLSAGFIAGLLGRGFLMDVRLRLRPVTPV